MSLCSGGLSGAQDAYRGGRCGTTPRLGGAFALRHSARLRAKAKLVLRGKLQALADRRGRETRCAAAGQRWPIASVAGAWPQVVIALWRSLGPLAYKVALRPLAFPSHHSSRVCVPGHCPRRPLRSPVTTRVAFAPPPSSYGTLLALSPRLHPPVTRIMPSQVQKSASSASSYAPSISSSFTTSLLQVVAHNFLSAITPFL